MRKYFGTDGIRGLANIELTPEISYRVGKSLAILNQDKVERKVLVGRDTRLSGDLIFTSLAAGLMSGGMDVVDLGIIPTPAVSFLTVKEGAAAGIVISASHNPYGDNGIKIFSSDGFKLSDEEELEIERYIDQPSLLEEVSAQGKEVGRLIGWDEGHRAYIDYIKSRTDADLSGLKIAMDFGYGATATVAREIFEELGAEVIGINSAYDGTNINDNCGSTNPGLAVEAVVESQADLGLSFDGDGDRLIAIDEVGKILDGDHFLAAMAYYMDKTGKLRSKTVVGTVMANVGLKKFLEDNGMKLVVTQVGDKYVLEEMVDKNYSIGGEQSGHFIFIDDNTTGDGILSGLKLLELMVEEGVKLSELGSLMTSYPQVLKNARVLEAKKMDFQDDESIQEAISQLEERLKGEGRVLIRPSGTEPLIRVMVEGQDEKVLKDEAGKLVHLIEERLGE